MNASARTCLKYLALYAVVVMILFLRLPGAFTHPNFFAEDGNIFFREQYELGFWKALFTYYAGYLHFVPRIVAGICSVLPLLWQPFAYSAASLLLAAFALTLFASTCFRPVIESDSLRALIVVMFTLMPNQDLVMKLAYVNFYMGFILMLVVMAKLPANRAALWLLFAIVSLVAWTTPVVIALFPLTVIRIFTTKQTIERVWWALLSLEIFGYYLTTEKTPGLIYQFLHDPNGIMTVIKGVSYKVFCFFHIGRKFSAPNYLVSWSTEAVVSTILIILCLIALIKVRRPVLWIMFYMTIAVSAMFALRPTSWQGFVTFDEVCWRSGDRYFLCGTLMLCVFWGMVYERALHPWALKSQARQNFCVMALLAWLTLHETNFRQWEWRSSGASWEVTCENIMKAKKLAEATREKQILQVEISPVSMNFPLTISP